MGHILKKNCFSILIESHTAKLCYPFISLAFSETNTEIHRNFFFLPCYKGANPEENLDRLNNSFWSNQLKGININKNCVSPQCEPHTAKLCLSVVFMYFWLNSQRIILFKHKSDYRWNEHWNTQKVCFYYHVWKGAYPEENLDLFKQLFLIEPVKADKY